MRKTTLIFAGIILLAVAAAFFVWPDGLGGEWKLGLDLIGGAHLTYEADMSGTEPADRDSVLSGLRDVMEHRVNAFGVSEPLVAASKSGESHRLIIELAGISDVNEAIGQIGRTALLEFREARIPEDAESVENIDWLPSKLTGKYLKRAQVIVDNLTGQAQIAIAFNSEGAKIFEEITGANIGLPLAIFLDGELISAPVVRDAITGGEAVISGDFTFREAKDLASLLNAGALPAPVKLISQQTVGATLGLDSLRKTVTAGIAGTLAVMIFMLAYYRLWGFTAAAALAIYIIFTLAVFKGISMTMTLSGIAGFILSIGMAVDANILIFERAKEEVKKGFSRASSLKEGFRRAWPSIRDSNITTIITSLILYYLTTSFVKGFALALFLGVLVSMFTAVFVTRNVLKTFTMGGIK